MGNKKERNMENKKNRSSALLFFVVLLKTLLFCIDHLHNGQLVLEC